MKLQVINSAFVGLVAVGWIRFFSGEILPSVGAVVMAAYLYSSTRGHRQSAWAALLSFLLGGLGMFFLGFKFWPLIILGLLYQSDFFPLQIRTLPYAKSFYIALCWALLSGLVCGKETFWITYFWIWGLCQPFDVRDIKQDRFPSLPKLVGKRRLLVCSILAIGIAAVLAHSCAFSLSAGITAFLIALAGPDRPRWYFCFVLEGTSLLPWLVSSL